MENILITGGTGYIGSHTCIELIQAGYNIVIFDNLSNSNLEVINRIKKITGKDIKYIIGDLTNKDDINSVFKENNISSVIHFAGFKAVGESVRKPLSYYDNNLIITLNLCQVMSENGVFDLVFSSSATVYGLNENVPLKEKNLLKATNPYGWTKVMIEQILDDLAVSDARWRIAKLRYFNPVGGHSSGLMGEDPKGIPNNLVPYITQVAVGKLEQLQVYGNDYTTKDGTGIRDYIHVMDLASGHVKALENLKNYSGSEAYNLGTGTGYSVLDVIHTFEQVIKDEIPYKIVDRRPGDIGVSFADPSKAERELGWKAKRSLFDMLQDAWRWQQLNPDGYRKLEESNQ